MAGSKGNLVGWEGCVCGVQGRCDYCKQNSGEISGTVGCARGVRAVPRGDVDVGKRLWVFFHGESCIFSQWAMSLNRLQ